ncbi:hypothetical protein DFJ73DRAFT_61626 [Zopfochytrium polystomum]|nr:hypothetical protein DFJ73DRAFT_61626 [Zopfochytrium polystomum]
MDIVVSPTSFLSRLPDTLLLEIALVLDIVSLWRLSRSCRRLRARIFGSRLIWIHRLAAVERAANVPLTPNQTWGLAGLRNLVHRVHPRPRSPAQSHGSDAPQRMRVLQIEETVGIPWTPLGYGSVPVREPPARPQRVVCIIPIYSRSRKVIRGHSPCVLKDRCGILIGGDTQVAANTPGWSWLDIQNGRRVRFPETSVLANAGPTDEIVCLPGTDFVVHGKAANFELSLLKWDDAVEDFVPVRPCPLAAQPRVQAMLKRGGRPIIEATTGLDGSAWLWFRFPFSDDRSLQVLAFRARPSCDESGAVVSHNLTFVRLIKLGPAPPGGAWGATSFGAGIFSATKLVGHRSSSEVYRATDGRLIFEQVGPPLRLSGTKAFVRMEENDILRPTQSRGKTAFNFAVLDLLAAACGVPSSRGTGGLSNFQHSESCRVDTDLDTDWIVTKCMSGVDFKYFDDRRNGRFKFLDWSRQKCHIFALESVPSSQQLAAIVLYEDFAEGGEPCLRAEFHLTPFQM